MIGTSFTKRARVILAFGLLLGQIVGVTSQSTVDASDLPSCAGPCASTAAIAAGCSLSDTACLCSHPAFSDATRTCSRSVCGIEDRSSVNGVLNDMCSAAPPPASSSSSSAASTTSGTASQSSHSASGSASRPPNSSATGTGTVTNNPSATTESSPPAGTIYTVGSSSQSASSSSTVLVVQTVVLPQSTNFSSASRVGVDLGVGPLAFVGQVAMALGGMVWVLL